jgi:uncharacterized damage-inducible protein DinB
MPLTPTGTNLLGVVKHVVSTEVEYLGLVFDRPFAEQMPWMDPDGDHNADMWATEHQTIDWIRDFAQRAWAHADETIDAFDLDAPGMVPWWPEERRNTTLRTVLVHVIAEEARHAGQLDILREMTDGSVGLADGMANLPELGDRGWSEYTDQLRRLAESFD